jgi:drug/metabolite transporter (DMT)-like permease
MKSWLKNIFQKFFVVASQETRESSKILRLSLVWILSFFAVIRAFALLQFLVDLDYSEIETVYLVRFVFERIAILTFLTLLIYCIWQRPSRGLVCLLIGLSFFTLWGNTDYISVFSASVVLSLSSLLYVKLFKQCKSF